MTEENTPTTIEYPENPSPGAPNPRRREILPLLCGLGFVVLAGAIFYVWQYPSTSGELAAQASASREMQQRIAEMDARVSKLEQRPVPDIGKLVARMDAVEGRLVDQTQIGSRLDALSGRIESLSGRDQTNIDATKQQLDTLSKRIGTAEGKVGNLDGVSTKLNRVGRLQEATLALAAGHPVGDISGAPEAIARYAHTPPPTEAQIRLSFSPAERAALAASQPDAGDEPFVGRIWERAQGLITIRRGGDVVVGDQSAIILGHARSALDAGDLAGAVSAVSTLKGEAAQAMADWLSQAKALLSARSALADMADHA